LTCQEPSSSPVVTSDMTRTWLVVGASAAVHVAVLVVAFMSQTRSLQEGPRATTRVVQVLTGHVDPDTGDFQATGFARARVKD